MLDFGSKSQTLSCIEVLTTLKVFKYYTDSRISYRVAIYLNINTLQTIECERFTTYTKKTYTFLGQYF